MPDEKKKKKGLAGIAGTLVGGATRAGEAATGGEAHWVDDGTQTNIGPGEPKQSESWWDKTKRIGGNLLETGADVATLGGYSAAREGMGYGDSGSYIDPLTEMVPGRDTGERAWGAIGRSQGVHADQTGLGPGSSGGTGGAGGAGDIASIDGDARTLFNAAMGGVNRSYTPGTIRDPAPVRTPGLAPAGQVRAMGPAAVQGYDAAQIGGIERVNAPSLGVTSEVLMPRHMDAAQAKATDPGQVTIDRGDSDQMRVAQQQNLTDLQQEAAGQGAGAALAKAKLASAMADIDHSAFSQASGARGAGRTGLQREAMLASGRNALGAALKGAELEQGQILGARQQLTEALGGVRGQDQDLAAEQARLTQQSNTVRAQLETAVSQGNAQEVNRLQMQLRDLEQQTRTVNANAINRRAEVKAGMELEAATGNANRRLSADTTNVGATNTSRQFGANAANTADLDYVGRVDNAATGNADRDQRTDIERARQEIQVQEGNASRGLQGDVARDNAGRGAFDSTTTARGSAISGGNQAVGNRVNLIAPTTQAREANDKRQAQNDEFLLEAGTNILTRLGGGTPSAPAGPAPTKPKRPSFQAPILAEYGGIVDQPSIAGEAGPELVIPITGAKGALRQALGAENKPAQTKLDMDSDLAEQLIAKVFKSRKGRAA